MNKTLVKCHDLAVGYNGTVVKEGINFQVNQGDFLCILGDNGAGKSTLLSTLVGLLPPINGDIIKREKLEIGYMPQVTQVQQNFPATVGEIVQLGSLKRQGLLPFYSKEEKERAKKQMQNLDLCDLRKKKFSHLSGGQKQRVLLARALTASKELLILDEPVSGLDRNSKKEFYDYIQKLNAEGLPIIMITHQLQEAIDYGSHYLVFNKDGVKYYEKNSFVMTRGEY